jgi:hypothetical protein
MKQVCKGDYVWNLLNVKCADPSLFAALSWRGNEADLPRSHFVKVTSVTELMSLPQPQDDSASVFASASAACSTATESSSHKERTRRMVGRVGCVSVVYVLCTRVYVSTCV